MLFYCDKLLKVVISLGMTAAACGPFTARLVAEAGAPSDFIIDRLTPETELPSNRISGFAQGTDGFLWLISDESLSRFDGRQFFEIDANALAPTQAPLERASSAAPGRLLSGRSGMVWVTTAAGYLWRWNGKALDPWQTERATPTAFLSEFELSREEVLGLTRTGKLLRCRQNSTQLVADLGRWGRIWPETICLDKASNLWCVAEQRHVLRADLRGQVQAVPLEAGLGRPRALAVDASGQVWLGSTRGAFVWKENCFSPVPKPQAAETFTVEGIFPSASDGLWVLADEQAWLWRAGEWLGPIGNWKSPGRALAHVVDNRDRLWLGFDKPGLWCLTPDGLAKALPAEAGLSSAATALFADREGNVWASLKDLGLARIHDRTFQSVQATQGGRPVPVWNVAQDGGGQLWFYPDRSVPVPWDPSQGSELVLEEKAGTDTQWTKALAADRKGDVWYAARQRGIESVTASSVPSLPWPRAATFARVLFQDQGGRWWLGSDAGLTSWADGRWQAWKTGSGLPPLPVRAVCENQEGLWVGTFGGGLYRWDRERFSNLDTPPAPGLNFIYTLCPGGDGSLWIGTQGGLLRRQRSGRLSRYTTGQGLPDARVVQILEDGLGYLWLGTRDGLCRIPLASINALDQGTAQNLECSVFDERDGLPSRLFQDRASPGCVRSGDGRLWFLTAAGAASCRPESLFLNNSAPPAIMEEVRVDGERVAPPVAAQGRGPTSLYPQPPLTIGAPETIDLAPGSHTLEIRYTAANLSMPEKVRFEYRMEGLDANWIRAGNQRLALYTLRAPGDYWFRVRACNQDGRWSEALQGLNIVVRPFPWQRPWFPSLAALGLVAVTGTAGAFAQKARSKKQFAALEMQRAKEAERTRIARDLHDQLGAGLTEIGMLAEDAATPAEGKSQVRQQLLEIAAKTRGMAEELDAMVWAVDPRQDTLPSLAGYLGSSVEERAAAAGLRARVEVSPALPNWLMNAEARHHLNLAVREAIHNAVRHGGGTELSFALRLEGRELRIRIQDNGRGFDPTAVKRGNGLGNLRERLELIGGRCEIESSPGAGTIVRLQYRFEPSA